MFEIFVSKLDPAPSANLTKQFMAPLNNFGMPSFPHNVHLLNLLYIILSSNSRLITEKISEITKRLNVEPPRQYDMYHKALLNIFCVLTTT